jgi:hypothetical protein
MKIEGREGMAASVKKKNERNSMRTSNAIEAPNKPLNICKMTQRVGGKTASIIATICHGLL